ncbi:hypothetical protein ARMSODRAFT_440713 [Armillaria solidipes]|uniref:F-box domain-containing protein n=1 Tax=Armillaria solidipes TaxID=1076256 RepID=A0A2H3BQC9_9AGAR|nr:hypothetical protein ARMSODRAFT_440713 [Armillaria solidipes]
MITACVHDLMIPPSIPAASPQPIIPQELIDIIIDYLYNDTRSLRACALVASSWSGRSQQNLFLRIALAGKPWPDKRKSRTSAELFLRLIESAPHIPSFVRHLEIIEGDAFRSYRWLARSMPILDRILPTLTNLRTFHINFTGLLWRDIPGIHTSFLSISKHPDLRKVTISSITSVPSLNGLFTLFEDHGHMFQLPFEYRSKPSPFLLKVTKFGAFRRGSPTRPVYCVYPVYGNYV